MSDPSASGGTSQSSRQVVFLERHSYRRRRLMDAARFLPFVGAGLFLIPLLWATPADGGEAMRMSQAFLYVFGVWVVLIILSALFGYSARRWSQSEPPGQSGQD